MPRDADFYATVRVFSGFSQIMDPLLYEPLPQDWLIGVADVVDSSAAIERGRYKAVNMVGAAVIASVANGLGRGSFPFVFGGDGASLAIGPEHEAMVRTVLASTARWARDELGLELRVALIPVAAIREAGLDVRVARFAPSPEVSYAMFAGGGLAWAERALKQGRFAIAPAPPGHYPDLSGLSCHFEAIPSTRGVILSLLLVPADTGEAAAFRDLVQDLLSGLEGNPEVARPMPENGPALRWPPAGLDLVARAAHRPGGSLALGRATWLARTFATWLIFRFGIRVRGFDPARYLRQLAENSDFRKYDDGLRMTIDCTPEVADRLEQRLTRAETDGIARFGLHRQPAAIMTCFVPSVYEGNHIHFIDGAAGGYARAAHRLKAPTQPAADSRCPGIA